MRALRTTLAALLVIFASGLSASAQAADPSITISGVTFSWPEKIFRPVGRSTVTITVKNNSGVEALGAYELVNAFGSTIYENSAVQIQNGQTSYINTTWYEQGFYKSIDYAEPLKLILYVDFYTSARPEPAPVSVEFKFADRPDIKPTPAPTVTVTASPAPAPTVTVTATPKPAPTVTVTATPSPAPTVTVTATPSPAPTVTVTARPAIDGVDVALLNTKILGINNQLKTLNAKLKKICSAKPKPKGC